MVVPSEETQFLHQIEMGLGAWSWGDRIFWNYGSTHKDEDIEEAVKVSLSAGINFIDTAEVYGQGRSERLTGEYLRNAGKPAFVATKFFPYPWRVTRGALTRALRHSLERLGMEKVDLYQLHWPFPPMPVEHWVEAVAHTHRLGMTRTIGVSNYDKNQMQRAITILAKYDIPLAANQVEYNLLNRSIEKNGLLDRCKELGVRLIAYSPLAMGMLTGKYTPEKPAGGVRGSRYSMVLKDIQPLIKLMTEIGQDYGGKTPAQIALNWCICKGTLPIPGAKNAHQAEINAGTLGWRLTEDQVCALDAASSKIMK